MLSSIKTVVEAKDVLSGPDDELSAGDLDCLKMQKQFSADLQNQEPVIVGGYNDRHQFKVYSRPTRPGSIPKLQGPFQLDPELEDDADICDLFVMGLNADNDEDYTAETDLDDELSTEPGIAGTIICLLTTNAKVHIYLDLEGVEAAWLPRDRRRSLFTADEQFIGLILFETVNLLGEGQEMSTSIPSFTADIYPGHSLFITHDTGVYYLSLNSWTHKLRAELLDPVEAGESFRLDLLVEGAKSLIERPLLLKPSTNDDAAALGPATCVVLDDSDTGYLLLTHINGSQAQAALLDRPPSADTDGDIMQAKIDFATHEPREPYQAPNVFYEAPHFQSWYEDRFPPRQRRGLGADGGEIKLSPLTLDALTQAHKVLSDETRRLQSAASDLFLRCERMQEEFREQIRRADDLAGKVDAVVGDDDEEDAEDEGQGEDGQAGAKSRLRRRLLAAQSRQDELNRRHADLRAKLARMGGKGMSDGEKAFADEVARFQRSILGPEDGGEEVDDSEKPAHELEQGYAGRQVERLEEVKRLRKELVARGREVAAGMGGEVAGASAGEDGEIEGDGVVKVPRGFRRRRIEEVFDALEREEALVKATGERLERLNLNVSLGMV